MPLTYKKPNIVDESYYYAVDDHCLVVSSGAKPGNNNVWLSSKMCQWIAENYKQVISHCETPKYVEKTTDYIPEDALWGKGLCDILQDEIAKKYILTENKGSLTILQPFKHLRGQEQLGNLMGYARDKEDNLYAITVAECSAPGCACATHANAVLDVGNL